MPDLDRHCARFVRSAEVMGLEPPATAAEIEALLREGVRRLGTERPLYLRPMLWSRECSPALIDADPGSTAMAICLEDLAFRAPGPMSLTVSPFAGRRRTRRSVRRRRPATIPTTPASCARRGRAVLLNALSLDQEGLVAETASTNVFAGAGRGGADPRAERDLPERRHPAAGDRASRADGVEVVETALTVADFASGRRDLRDRQRQQGAARHPLRAPRAAARPACGARPRALLGFRPPGAGGRRAPREQVEVGEREENGHKRYLRNGRFTLGQNPMPLMIQRNHAYLSVNAGLRGSPPGGVASLSRPASRPGSCATGDVAARFSTARGRPCTALLRARAICARISR